MKGTTCFHHLPRIFPESPLQDGKCLRHVRDVKSSSRTSVRKKLKVERFENLSNIFKPHLLKCLVYISIILYPAIIILCLTTPPPPSSTALPCPPHPAYQKDPADINWKLARNRWEVWVLASGTAILNSVCCVYIIYTYRYIHMCVCICMIHVIPCDRMGIIICIYILCNYL